MQTTILLTLILAALINQELKKAKKILGDVE